MLNAVWNGLEKYFYRSALFLFACGCWQCIELFKMTSNPWLKGLCAVGYGCFLLRAMTWRTHWDLIEQLEKALKPGLCATCSLIESSKAEKVHLDQIPHYCPREHALSGS